MTVVAVVHIDVLSLLQYLLLLPAVFDVVGPVVVVVVFVVVVVVVVVAVTAVLVNSLVMPVMFIFDIILPLASQIIFLTFLTNY